MTPGPAGAQGGNPFGQGQQQTETGQAAEPSLFRQFTFEMARLQREANARLSSEIRRMRDEGTWSPALVIMMLSFLYGVFHAAGPGHGKMVTTAYFVANRARAVHGIMMASMIAFVQAISAILIVGVFAVILDVGALTLTRNVVYVEMASYGLIAAIGLYILYGGIVGKGCSHHHHSPGNGDGHGHDHDHDHAPPVTTSLRAMVPTAIAAGIRPCTGSVLVLLFTLANGVFLVGVASAFVMAIGVALTISLLGLGVIVIRRGVAAAAKPNEAAANFAHRMAGIVGGLFVIAVGALLFLGTLERTGFGI